MLVITGFPVMGRWPLCSQISMLYPVYAFGLFPEVLEMRRSTSGTVWFPIKPCPHLEHQPSTTTLHASQVKLTCGNETAPCGSEIDAFVELRT